MRRIKFLSVFVLLALVLSAGVSAFAAKGPPQVGTSYPSDKTAMLQEPTPENCELDSLAAQAPDVDLQPGVREFIAGNYLAHAAEFPDPNEPVEPLRLYLDGVEMLRAGETDEAVTLFKSAVADYPDSRHTHAGLGRALWQRYQQSQVEDDLRAATTEFIRADEIGMKYGRVHYTDSIAIGLGWLKDAAALDSYFEKALKGGNEPYLARLDYARGLSLLEDPRAEKWYEEAMAVEPEGLADAVAYYAEWLLDHGREAEVADLVRDDIRVEYVHFLKGVALERLGRPEEARREYERYRRLNAAFPAPARYRVTGSEAQAGLVFEGDIQPLWSESQARAKLSRVIASEAESESVGGQRAVGWTVRTRVFRAYYVHKDCGGYSVSPNTWGALPSSASLADKYVAICDASGQFADGREPTPSTNSRADEVWYGAVPDPVSCNCVWGYIMGSCCNGSCSHETTQGAFPHGPAWIYSDRYVTPPAYHPSSSCSRYKEETCPNGGAADNWFYKIK